MFYSDLDAVQIAYDKDSFRITEYIQLGIHQEYTYYPFEKTVLHFKDLVCLAGKFFHVGTCIIEVL